MVGVMDLLLNVWESSQFIPFCHFVEYYIVLFIISMSNILVVILLYMYGLLNWIDVYFCWMFVLNKPFHIWCLRWYELKVRERLFWGVETYIALLNNNQPFQSELFQSELWISTDYLWVMCIGMEWNVIKANHKLYP